ncbi:MAG: hypothetical protein GTN69_06915 [Armatimonadetes bacterium]|nr:hypothetical protein [Armatimonadota bacterium]
MAIGRLRFHPQGSFDMLMINDTGAVSVPGTLVSVSTATDFAVRVNPAQRVDVTMVVHSPNVPVGGEIWCTLFGRCQVLLADSTGTTTGNWVRRHATIDGRADGTATQQPDEGNPEVYPTSTRKHLFGLGRALETVTAGTDKLAWIMMLHT